MKSSNIPHSYEWPQSSDGAFAANDAVRVLHVSSCLRFIYSPNVWTCECRAKSNVHIDDQLRYSASVSRDDQHMRTACENLVSSSLASWFPSLARKRRSARKPTTPGLLRTESL